MSHGPSCLPCSPSPAEAWLFVGTNQINPARAHGSHGAYEPPRVAEETSHECAFCDLRIQPVVFNSLTSICGPQSGYKPQTKSCGGAGMVLSPSRVGRVGGQQLC